MKLPVSVYAALLLVALTASALRWKSLSRADRCVGLLLALTLLQESLAYLLTYRYRNNLASYHFYSPLELSLTCIYLCEATSLLRGRKWQLGLCSFAVLVGICNTVFLQPLTVFNSYYLLFESCVIILLSLVSLYEVLLREENHVGSRSQFWITVGLLLYWSSTFLGWGIYNVFPNPRPQSLTAVFVTILSCANFLFYSGIGLVFIRYKRMIPSGA